MSAPLLVYTDGAGPEHGSPAAWSFIVTRRVQGGDGGLLDIVAARSGLEYGGTNQTAELLGVTEGLSWLIMHSETGEVISDSAYVVNGLNDRWFDKWRSNGWTSSKGQPVANRPLWERLVMLWESDARQDYGITIRHVRGHGRGNDAEHDVNGNHIADRIAESARDIAIATDAEAGV